MKKTTLVLLLASCLTSSSLLANQHISVGIESGYGTLSTERPYSEASDALGIILDKQTTSGSTYRIYLADWIDTKSPMVQWGVEAGYWTYPESHYRYNFYATEESTSSVLSTAYNGTAIDLLAGLRIHFNTSLFATLQAGAAYVRNKADIAATVPFDASRSVNILDNTAKTELLPEWSIGIGSNLSEHWTLGFSYRTVIGAGNKAIDLTTAESATDLFKLDATPSSISAYLLNLSYTF